TELSTGKVATSSLDASRTTSAPAGTASSGTTVSTRSPSWFTVAMTTGFSISCAPGGCQGVSPIPPSLQATASTYATGSPKPVLNRIDLLLVPLNALQRSVSYPAVHLRS